MIPVNPYFLHVLLEPITGLADDDEAVTRYRSVDLNDEAESREIITRLIVPHASSLGGKTREKTQLAYRYYLSKEDSRWENVFDSVLPPFKAPRDVRLFFCWLYEECFQSTDYGLPRLEDYVEVPDVNEPLAIWEEEYPGPTGGNQRG
jgi:hypothetical protein